jgi:hydroxyacylglutathione hydrolase
MQPIQFVRKDITVFTSAIYQTTSTLLQTPNAIFLIDPNWLPFEIFRIKEYIDSVRRDRKLYLIFTHSDYDHIIGYAAFPDARVIASQAFTLKKDKEADVQKAVDWDKQHYIKRTYPILYPRVDIVIDKDGKSMHFDGTVLTFYLAPGHTREGMYIVFEPAGAWISGDYLSDVEFPLIEDDIIAYRHTMAKTDRMLRAHGIKWLIPGHGTVANSEDEILLRRDHATEYLDDFALTIDKGEPFPIEKYRRRYLFWEGLQASHHAQINQWSV